LRTPISTSDDGTVYLNSASVPRIIHKGDRTQRNFSLVTLQSGVVTQASLVWVDKDYSVISEEILYQFSPNQAETACSQL
ncbi:TIGR04168 family protein, partial [Aerosakkonemataceae cyanobacterium BLCC-F167]